MICGAGDNARNFLDYKPSNCQVKYIVDSDTDKVGIIMHGVKVFDRNHLAAEKEKVIVLLTFNGEKTENWLESLGVEWYKSYGRNDKNFFCRKEIVRYIDDEYFDYRPDMRLIKQIIEMNYTERICICDLGCGNGELLLNLDNDKYDLYGVDLSEKRVFRLASYGINAVSSRVEKYHLMIDQWMLFHVWSV